jgi:hypothetical protein
MKLAAALLAAMAGAAGAADADEAIARLARRWGEGKRQVKLLSRTAAEGPLDVVVAMNIPAHWLAAEYRGWWTPESRMSVYLQSRAAPGLIYEVASEVGRAMDGECMARVERSTAAEVVIACTPEKGGGGRYRKYLVDVRAKGLVNVVEYERFAMRRVRVSAERAVIAGTDGQRPVEVECAWDREPACRVLQGAAPVGELKTQGGKRLLGAPLPQSTYEEFARARPKRVKDGYVREGTKISEGIGPRQKFEGVWWVGKSFYDAEGSTGVGGFGFLDESAGKFRMYAPPEIVDWSVTAMLVEKDSVWLGLASHSEWRSYGGGLLRFDRRTERADRIAMEDMIGGIARLGGGLVMATEWGVAMLEGGRLRRFFVDKTLDGRLRVLEAGPSGAAPQGRPEQP